MCALCAATLAIASVVGADTPPGNALEPRSQPGWIGRDARGMTLLTDLRRRSPSGILYPYPPERAPYRSLGERWRVRGLAELGVFFDGGDPGETRYERFSERDDELFLSGFALELLRPDTNTTIELVSGSAGRDDQFWRLDAGRPGIWRFRSSFSRSRGRTAADAVSLSTGLGGDTLGLAGGLVAGANGPAAVAAVAAARPPGVLESHRDRSDLAFDWRFAEGWKAVASYRLEDRSGAHPRSTGFSFPTTVLGDGAVFELAEPTDDRTHTLAAGVEWSGTRAQANLQYRGSLYHNRNDAVTFDQPFSFGLGGVQRGRLSLAPDNSAHNLRGDVAVTLPGRTRITSSVSWSTMRQDEALLPHVVNSANIGGTDLTLWNGPGSLNQSSADARIDSLLVDFSLLASPWKTLRVKARVRYFDRENHTRYLALNPNTGALGTVLEDGGHLATFGPGAEGFFGPGQTFTDVRFRSTPYGGEKETYTLEASWRAPAGTRVTARWQNERVDRDHRERRRTDEQRLRLSVVSRGLPGTTARLSWEVAERDGSSFDVRALDRFYTSRAPGFTGLYEPRNLAQLQRHDVADRGSQTLRAKIRIAIGASMDLAISASRRADDFRGDYGVTRAQRSQVHVEWSAQPSPALSTWFWASGERRSRDIAQIPGFGGSPNPNAGGANFPLIATWQAEADGTSWGFGAGVESRITPWLRVRTDYQLAVSHETYDYAFASFAALAAPIGAIPPRFPELRSRDHVWTSEAWIEIREGWALRLYHRLEHSSIDDFAQAGLVPVLGPRAFLAHVDRDFVASVYGIAVQMRF